MKTRLKQARSAFTMIEIAISLAVIGFALVAIVGILPIGMGAQKVSRQETIITQDASIFMNAIRNGERGLDDLTNYVMAITNFSTVLDDNHRPLNTTVYGYTRTNSTMGPPPGPYPTMNPPYPITNGLRIVGLLARPRFEGAFPPRLRSGDRYISNYIVAYVRSLSGLASEKFPQTNSAAQELAFNYRIFCDVQPASTTLFDWAWTNRDPSTIGSTNELAWRWKNWLFAQNYRTNLHDVRMTFRWGAGTTGGRQPFRTSVSGMMIHTNEPYMPNRHEYLLHFFEPRNYAQFYTQPPP